MKQFEYTINDPLGIHARPAGMLAKEANADLYEIKPAIPCTKEDLNWMDKKSRSSIEMGNKSFRPAIVKDELDPSRYDQILLGFPI